MTAVLHAAMPKTTIYKYNEIFTAKNEIRFAENFLISTPTLNTIGSEN